MERGNKKMAKLKEQEKRYLQKFWNAVSQAGNDLRNQEPPALTEEDFYLFEKTGNRLMYENAYFARRKYLTVFGILYEFGKRKKISRLSTKSLFLFVAGSGSGRFPRMWILRIWMKGRSICLRQRQRRHWRKSS